MSVNFSLSDDQRRKLDEGREERFQEYVREVKRTLEMFENVVKKEVRRRVEKQQHVADLTHRV